jgi:hypothetical protein
MYINFAHKIPQIVESKVKQLHISSQPRTMAGGFARWCPVAYPRIFFGGWVQQIQLRTEGRENRDWGGSSPLIRGSAQFANE